MRVGGRRQLDEPIDWKFWRQPIRKGGAELGGTHTQLRTRRVQLRARARTAAVLAGRVGGSADGRDPAKGVFVLLLLQPRQLVVQLQGHGARLPGGAKLPALALVGEGAHGGDHDGGAGGEDLQRGRGRAEAGVVAQGVRRNAGAGPASRQARARMAAQPPAHMRADGSPGGTSRPAVGRRPEPPTSSACMASSTDTGTSSTV